MQRPSAEQGKRPLDVADAIEGLRLGVARESVEARIVSISLLQIGRVAQNDLRESERRIRAPDRPREALLDEARQVARVIHMGVGEQDVADRGRRYGELRPIGEPQFLHSLEHARVDEDAPVAGGRRDVDSLDRKSVV